MIKLSREVFEHRRFSLRTAGVPVSENALTKSMEKRSCSEDGDTLLEKYRDSLLLASRGYQQTRMSGGNDGE